MEVISSMLFFLYLSEMTPNSGVVKKPIIVAANKRLDNVSALKVITIHQKNIIRKNSEENPEQKIYPR